MELLIGLDLNQSNLTNSMVIQVSNIIFLDSPVGTGFSYSVKEQGYNSSDTKAVNQILIFLKKVLSPASLISIPCASIYCC